MEVVLFYALAFIILASALMMTISKNLVHAAFLMIASFIGIAGIYILLLAEFLALIQILVYVGAISILLVFGVMLTRRGKITESNLINKNGIIAALVALIFFAVVCYSAGKTAWVINADALPASSIEHIAGLILNEQAVPFEISGVLLLVSMIGAIIIGKGASKLK